ASHGLLGRIQRANDVAAHRFGPHTAEVEAFILAAGQLTPWQWRQVQTTRRLVASVSKDGAAAVDSARSIQAAIRTSDARISEPMARAGEVLFDTLAKRSDDKQVAAWQAMTALIMRSHLPALKFAVHCGRVLGALADLAPDETAQLWAPLAPVIPLAALSEPETPLPAAEVVRAAVNNAIRSITRPPRSRVPATSPAKAAAPYGPNPTEVAAFVKGVTVLSPIQWLRVLDRRRLVASVTREGAVEPAGVVRSILIALEATRELDTYTRWRAFTAVERAGYVVESHGGMNLEQVREALTPFAPSIAFESMNGGGFAHQVASLDRGDWQRVAAAAPEADVERVAPLVSAAPAL